MRKLSPQNISTVSPQNQRRVVTLRGNGATYRTIAKEVGSSNTVIYRILSNAGMTTSHEEIEERNRQRRVQIAALYRWGMSTPRIARLIGVSPAAVWQHLKTAGVQLRSTSENQYKPLFYPIVAMLYGCSAQQAADMNNTSREALYVRLHKRGFTLNNAIPKLRRLNEAQLEVYRTALDEDMLPHPDALEIAKEY